MSDRLTLTREDAAELLGLGVSTVDLMIAAGEIPSIKLRGRRFFLRSTLEQWLIDQQFLGVHRDGVA